jgi:hypothetical protein
MERNWRVGIQMESLAPATLAFSDRREIRFRIVVFFSLMERNWQVRVQWNKTAVRMYESAVSDARVIQTERLRATLVFSHTREIRYRFVVFLSPTERNWWAVKMHENLLAMSIDFICVSEVSHVDSKAGLRVDGRRVKSSDGCTCKHRRKAAASKSVEIGVAQKLALVEVKICRIERQIPSCQPPRHKGLH